MLETLIGARNYIIAKKYQWILKPIFFKFDPEDTHNFATLVGRLWGKYALTRKVVNLLFGYKNQALEQTITGINFKNPIGLSAGFDKDIQLTDVIGSVGFGFTEVGSITAMAYDGNPKPRLWRLPKTKSLGVWYGLKNKGVEFLSRELAQKTHYLPIGASIAFTNCRENLNIDSAIRDYKTSAEIMEKYADYITINLSCPSTSGGMPFILKDNYDKLMTEIDKIPTLKPIWVKISPDMTHLEIDEFLNTSSKHRVHGIICSNLSKKYHLKEIKDPQPPHGGLSGKVVFPKALDLLSYMYRKVGNKYIFVFCGGVFSAHDAYKAIKQGASLVQLITGMIFEGPQLISDINLGLVKMLKADGYKNISEAVGVANR